MLVLDTFNVLHTVGILPPDLAGLDVPGLAQLILRSRFAGEKIVFACDGLPAADLPGPGALALSDHPNAVIEVRFSGKGVTADDLIRRMIEASTAPRRMTIVSTDHAIARDARKRRCVTLTSEEFLQQLADDAGLPRGPAAPPRRPPPMMTESQVSGWIEAFGVDDESLDALLDDDEGVAPAPPRPNVAPNPAVRLDVEMPTPILPENLVDEAEALWLGATRPPPPPTPAAIPAPPAPVAASPTPSPAPEPSPEPIEEIDLSAIDMNAILPDDGQTRPLQRKGNRDRKPAK